LRQDALSIQPFNPHSSTPKTLESFLFSVNSKVTGGKVFLGLPAHILIVGSE